MRARRRRLSLRTLPEDIRPFGPIARRLVERTVLSKPGEARRKFTPTITSHAKLRHLLIPPAAEQPRLLFLRLATRSSRQTSSSCVRVMLLRCSTNNSLTRSVMTATESTIIRDGNERADGHRPTSVPAPAAPGTHIADPGPLGLAAYPVR